MAQRKQSKAACTYCGKTMTKGAMAKHLGRCEKQLEAITMMPSTSCLRKSVLNVDSPRRTYAPTEPPY